jgi:hypothetical protein
LGRRWPWLARMSIAFDSLALPFGRSLVLAYGPDAPALNQSLFGPPVFVHVGYRLVGSSEYLLPHEAIDDRGQLYYEQEAVDWIEMLGGAFPRADAIGRLSSGHPAQARLKELDLAVAALYASAEPKGQPRRLDLAIEALAIPDGYALLPTAAPAELETYARGLRFYRLAPGVFGAVGAALVQRLLATGRADWRVTFDDVDDMMHL